MNTSKINSLWVRYFYTASALLMLVFTIIGFHHFYFFGLSYPGRPITPPIRELIILHGITMSLWACLIMAQPLLIAKHKHHIHKKLGVIGATLAMILVVLGLILAIKSVEVTPPNFKYGLLNTKQFMMVPFIGILMFGLYVALGVRHRNNPNIHKPMMFLATLAVIAAPLDRIDAVRNIFTDTIIYSMWGPFFLALLIGSTILLIRFYLTKVLDRYFAIGLVGLYLAFGIAMQIATTPTWEKFVGILIKI